MTQSYNQITGTYNFESIVRALQAQIAEGGSIPKEYPYNFQGITQAIQDLTFVTTRNPGADIGPKPSTGDVSIDANGNPVFSYSTTPLDGDLWFDSRQGRMFIAFENEGYQTNGGDGFPIVTATDVAPSATNLVLGQMWYDGTNDVLYIFGGKYRETDGTVTPTPTATTVPVWTQLLAAGGQQTTATLPIAGSTINTKVVEAVSDSNFLPTNVDPHLVTHQDDINLYFVDALLALDDQVKINQPYINIEPPSAPVPGQFWFDSSTIEMSIWYSAPGDAWGQWVPVFSPAKIDDNLNTLKTGLLAETAARKGDTTTLQTNIDAVSTIVTSNRSTVDNTLNGLQAQINAIPNIDVCMYATVIEQQRDTVNLQNQVNTTRGDIGTIYQTYASKVELTAAQQQLQTNIDAKASDAALTAAIATIPSVAGLASQTYVDTKIAANTGITGAGGTINGSLTIDKNDLAEAALDYSTHHYDGRLAQKYRTNCEMTTAHYATFGTNDKLYEYAWNFTDNEDFCWTHGTNGKVASIDKTGIAATNYYIATFGNNTTDGRSLTSTIDVGARLQTTKAALESLRTNAATATTLDELKTAIANALANV